MNWAIGQRLHSRTNVGAFFSWVRGELIKVGLRSICTCIPEIGLFLIIARVIVGIGTSAIEFISNDSEEINPRERRSTVIRRRNLPAEPGRRQNANAKSGGESEHVTSRRSLLLACLPALHLCGYFARYLLSQLLRSSSAFHQSVRPSVARDAETQKR